MKRTISSYSTNHYSQRLSIRLATRLTPLPLRFNDSANWLWQGKGKIFKLARLDQRHGHFWQGAKALFGLDRWHTPWQFQTIPARLPDNLPMPPVPMQWEGLWEGAPLWSQPFINGGIASWSPQFAAQLGEQCACLARHRSTRFGGYCRPVFDGQEWPYRLRRYLTRAMAGGALPSHVYHQLSQLPATAGSCVPLLLDMRTDQFLCSSDGYAWIDWEALVWAPLDFSLALQEITLPPGARKVFVDAMGTPSPIHLSRLNKWRPLYRSALLAMGVLGEISYTDMMAIDPWFDQVGEGSEPSSDK